MYRKLALLFIFLTTINPSFSQGIKGEEPVDKLSFSELIEQMLNKNDSVYVLKNTQVYCTFQRKLINAIAFLIIDLMVKNTPTIHFIFIKRYILKMYILKKLKMCIIMVL